MKRSRLAFLFGSILIIVVGIVGYIMINYIPCISTEDNLRTCLKYYGTMDIREVVSAHSANDITFKHDTFSKRTTIYYGKMKLDFWDLLEDTSMEKYKDDLNGVGLTWEFNNENDLVMYFDGVELKQKGGGL